jgi:hypothetical protein
VGETRRKSFNAGGFHPPYKISGFAVPGINVSAAPCRGYELFDFIDITGSNLNWNRRSNISSGSRHENETVSPAGNGRFARSIVS